jgi:hypothetical protein
MWVFEPGETVYIDKIDHGHAVAGREEAVVIEATRTKENDAGHWTMCWVEYPHRSVRYQRNGAVLPREQLWLHNDA